MKEYIVHAPENHILAVKDFKTFFGEPIERLTRCKDCRYWTRLEGRTNIGTCWMYARHPKSDSYCDMARRENDD